MLKLPKRRVTIAVGMLTALLVASGCGSRLPYDRLKADATGVAVVTPVGDASAVPGAPKAPGGESSGVGRTASGSISGSASAIAAAPGAASASVLAPSAPHAGSNSARVGRPLGAAGTAVAVSGQGTTSASNGNAGVVDRAAATAPKTATVSCTKALSQLRIGSIGQNSGVAGAIFGPGAQTLQAWAQWINAQGGVACHPVELFTGDDAGDPATDESLAQNFVEQKGVVAFVYMDAPFAGAASVKYLTEHRIPVFGSEGGSEWFNQNPTFFPQMSSGAQYVEGVFAMAGATEIPLGRTKMGSLTCVEAPICSSAYAIADKLAAKYGMTLVYRGQVSITQPSFTSSCLAAKNAGAQVIFLGYDGNSDLRTARSCASVDYHPVIVTPAVGLTPAQASVPDLAGIEVGMPMLPWFETANRAISDFVGALGKFAPGVPPTSVGVSAWIAGQVFAFAASQVGDRPTSAEIVQGAYRVKENDFGGLTQKLTYTAGAPNQIQRLCWWAARFDGTNVTSPNGGKETCQ